MFVPNLKSGVLNPKMHVQIKLRRWPRSLQRECSSQDTCIRHMRPILRPKLCTCCAGGRAPYSVNASWGSASTPAVGAPGSSIPPLPPIPVLLGPKGQVQLGLVAAGLVPPAPQPLVSKLLLPHAAHAAWGVVGAHSTPSSQGGGHSTHSALPSGPHAVHAALQRLQQEQLWRGLLTMLEADGGKADRMQSVALQVGPVPFWSWLTRL